MRTRGARFSLRSSVTAVLAVGALMLGAGGVIAASGQFSSHHNSAADHQYGPCKNKGKGHGKHKGCKPKKCPDNNGKHNGAVNGNGNGNAKGKGIGNGCGKKESTHH